MNNAPLRVYLTDHKKLWRVYKIWLGKDGSFYYTCPLKVYKNNSTVHVSVHPSGNIHTRLNGTKDDAVKKLNWPSYKEMSVIPIDSYGFDVKDFLNRDPVFKGLEKTKIESPSIVFDITKDIKYFQLRIWLGQTKNIEDFQIIKEKLVEVDSDSFLAAQFIRFGKVQPKLKDEQILSEFDLSCVIALVHLDQL